MAKFLRLRDGVPYVVDVPIGIPYDAYETLTIDKTLFELPNGQTYTLGQNELQVWVDGIAQVLGLDYTETDTTHITFTKTIKAGQTIRVRR
jgi:hypothetical protein